jgi:dipeptidyl-peptidase III
MVHEKMDESVRKQYLADDPPTVVPLAIKTHFDALNDQEKKYDGSAFTLQCAFADPNLLHRRYAHYISRAAFAGTRINLRQVSPESETIYDFILTLHNSANGESTLRHTVNGLARCRMSNAVEDRSVSVLTSDDIPY